MRSSIGTPKASVLPEPVGELATTSRPSSTSAVTRDWMANGAVIPRSESARTTARETPRSAKDCVDLGTPCGQLGHEPRTIREVPADPNRLGGGTQAS